MRIDVLENKMHRRIAFNFNLTDTIKRDFQAFPDPLKSPNRQGLGTRMDTKTQSPALDCSFNYYLSVSCELGKFNSNEKTYQENDGRIAN